ncbi:MAG: shikimate kinase [Planctomycetota bacterium]|jgi:XRE family aerobic/anaerobic benzoate catabolism transcriptional regulator
MVEQHPRILTELGRQVVQRRKDRNWTRRKLADRSGISERFLADVESGRANPSILRLQQVAEALSCRAVDLLEDEKAPSSEAASVVALLGLRGAGKTAVGSALADQLGCRFVELDALVEADAGIDLAQIFALHGEPYYRRSEQRILRELLTSPESPMILATGGGLVTERDTFRLLKNHSQTIWLKAAAEEHWSRVVAQGDTRPMAQDDKAFANLCEILSEREPLYRQADISLDTSGRRIEEIVKELAHQLQPEPAGQS